jgi:hypothetical protein
VTPSAALEALHMLEPLFFLHLLELIVLLQKVSLTRQVEQASRCEEHAISNKSSQEVNTSFFPTSQELVTCCNQSFDSCDELSFFLIFFENNLTREAC